MYQEKYLKIEQAIKDAFFEKNIKVLSVLIDLYGLDYILSKSFKCCCNIEFEHLYCALRTIIKYAQSKNIYYNGSNIPIIENILLFIVSKKEYSNYRETYKVLIESIIHIMNDIKSNNITDKCKNIHLLNALYG